MNNQSDKEKFSGGPVDGFSIVHFGFGIRFVYVAREMQLYFPDPDHPDRCVIRPVPPQPWNGEGLPPVGVRIEVKHKDARKDWARPDFYEATLSAVGKQLVIFAAEEDGNGCEHAGRIDEYLFRPIRTPEQIAAEDRRKEIATLVQHICADGAFDCDDPEVSAASAKIYDAGYRKQVQP